MRNTNRETAIGRQDRISKVISTLRVVFEGLGPEQKSAKAGVMMAIAGLALEFDMPGADECMDFATELVKDVQVVARDAS